jgi:hypothetical protein
LVAAVAAGQGVVGLRGLRGLAVAAVAGLALRVALSKRLRCQARSPLLSALAARVLLRGLQMTLMG